MSGAAQQGSQPLVVLDGVGVRRGGQRVLRGVSLTVRRGEVVVLVGPSGSGKSTLCRTVTRLTPVDEGTITVEGRPLPDGGPALARLRADVGVVPQSFGLFSHLTVLDNVTMGPVRVRGLPVDEAERRARQLLERVGVGALADRRPGQLSGGQQQRVAIARALAMDPVLVVCDEPTSALDPRAAEEVLDVLTTLARSGLTMLVVTHELPFARRAADRVVLLVDGEVVEQSPAERFFTSPGTPQARDFLSRGLHR